MNEQQENILSVSKKKMKKKLISDWICKILKNNKIKKTKMKKIKQI